MLNETTIRETGGMFEDQHHSGFARKMVAIAKNASVVALELSLIFERAAQ